MCPKRSIAVVKKYSVQAKHYQLNTKETSERKVAFLCKMKTNWIYKIVPENIHPCNVCQEGEFDSLQSLPVLRKFAAVSMIQRGKSTYHDQKRKNRIQDNRVALESDRTE
jgi:hypothetical protein